ncbi:MAG TPA: recombinase family protein [Thermomicrobiales bacterium]
MMTPVPRHAALYGRVSTLTQEAEGTSLDSQIDHCRKYAASNGFQVNEEHIFREAHTGAELWERRKLTQLRALIASGAIEAVIIYAVDRLSRKQAHIAILAEECDRANVSLLFVTEEFERSSLGEFIRNAKAFAAELEREKIKERTLRGKRTLAETGKLHNAGMELYGYRRDKEARMRIVEEHEATIVRRIFRLIGEERMSVRGVARQLNEEGLPPPSQGKMSYPDSTRVPRWQPSQLHRLLQNPAYKGEPYAWRWRRAKKHAHLSRPREEWLPLDAESTPALVTPELWQAAQDQLASNTGAETRNQKRPYLLRGHIFCAVCGARMYSNTEHGGYRVYRCSARDKASGSCGGKRVPAEAIEGHVWGQLSGAILDRTLIQEQLQAAREAGITADLEEERSTAKRALDTLLKQQVRLVRRLAEAEDDLATIIEREVDRVANECKALRTAIAAIDARERQEGALMVQLRSLDEYCARVADNLGEFDFEQKRLALTAFDVRVEANGSEAVGPWRVRGNAPVADAGVLSTTL